MFDYRFTQCKERLWKPIAVGVAIVSCLVVFPVSGEEGPVCIQGDESGIVVVNGECPDFGLNSGASPWKLEKPNASKSDKLQPERARSDGAAASPSMTAPSTAKSKTIAASQIPSYVQKIAVSPDERQAREQFDALVAQGDVVVGPLVSLYLDDDADARSRWVAGRALGLLPGPESTEALHDGLADNVAMVRVASIKGLMDQGDRNLRPQLLRALDDKAALVRSAALDALSDVGKPDDTPRIAQELTAPHNFIKGKGLFVRYHAADALGKIGGNTAIQALISVVDDGDPQTRESAQAALLKLSRRSTPPPGAGTEKQRWQAWFKANY